MRNKCKKFIAMLLCLAMLSGLAVSVGNQEMAVAKAAEVIETNEQIPYTAEEAARIVEAYYNNQLEYSYYGYYVIFSEETTITNREYQFLLRFCISEQRKMELMAQGLPETSSMFYPNRLIGRVTVDRYYGYVSIEYLAFAGGDEQGWHIDDRIFTDVKKSSWYHSYVTQIANMNIMTGLSDSKFGPGQPLARAQFAVILHRITNTPQTAYANTFPDVEDGLWYTDAIRWASGTGVVTGYADTGKFGPSDSINREQIAVMLYRYAKYMNYDVSQKADFSNFSDADMVNEFAKEAMQWAVGMAIISGKDNGTRLEPQGSATRAECATIIMRFLEMY